MNPHKSYPVTLLGALKSCIINKDLLAALSVREITGRYQGSILGLAWSFANPMIMLVVYTFVFSVVFKARWATIGSSNADVIDSKSAFALALFSGLNIYNLFAESAMKAPSLVAENVNYVKKVIFPLELLPVATAIASLFHFSISTFIWCVFYLIVSGYLQATIWLMPLFVIPLILFTLGVTWTLASLGVYIRDTSQALAPALTVLLFLTPVFYPLEAIPKNLRPIIGLNPLTYYVEQIRQLMFGNAAISITHYFLNLCLALAVASAGFAWFQITRRGFGDVL